MRIPSTGQTVFPPPGRHATGTGLANSGAPTLARHSRGANGPDRRGRRRAITSFVLLRRSIE